MGQSELAERLTAHEAQLQELRQLVAAQRTADRQEVETLRAEFMQLWREEHEKGQVWARETVST